MKKKLIFLPFINGSEASEDGRYADEDGRKWRKELEKNFLLDPYIGKLNDEINQIRHSKPAGNADAGAIADYYKRLHEKKSERQAEWLKRLTVETAVLFESKLDAMPDEVKNSDDCIIVAALPEFFWYDINDNEKHTKKDAEQTDAEQTEDDEPSGEGKVEKYIVGYHKPLYDTNMINILLHTKNNPLSKLTEKYNNLIIFAGTAMWKIINEENHKDERINNTLIIYHTGSVANTWAKHFFSRIDGFYTYIEPENDDENGTFVLVKNKKGEYKVLYDSAPITEFKGVKFTYDICYDFVMGTGDRPLSTDLCGGQKTDVNVLISAGMPIDEEDLTTINSPVILRCDGWAYPPYAEIAPRGAYPANNPDSILGGVIIGELETVI